MYSPEQIREIYSHFGLEIKSDGENRFACIIHGGKNPNLAINGSTGKWKCQSECGFGGDTTEFIMKYRGVDFKAARKIEESILGVSSMPKPANMQSRIVDTYEYVDAHGRPVFEVVRFDPKGFRQRRKEVDGKYTWNLNGVEKVPYRFPALLAAERVFLVEGEKDVHSLEGLGLAATTIPGGADGWRSIYAQHFAHKDVIILPDNDPAGAKFARAALEGLKPVANSVRVVKLPVYKEKGDVSDWIAAGGTREALDALIEEADKPPQGVSEPKQNKHSDDPLKPVELARVVMADRRFKTDQFGNVWIYEEPIWVQLTTEVAEHIVWSYDCIHDSKISKRKEALDAIRKETQIMDIMRSRLGDYEVPVRNGVLNLRKSTLRPHQAEDCIQTIIPWDFDPTARCPLWLSCIDFWFGLDGEKAKKSDLLQEFFGYLLFPHARYKQALLLVGKGDTGKSKVLETMIELVGEKNTTEVTVDRMDDPRELAQIAGKLLNAVGDMSRDAIVADGGFKKLVSSGDRISINPKYRDPQFIEPIAKHVFATNSMPAIEDESDATYRRLLILKFNRPIPVEMQDEALMAKLRAEMLGIVAWAAHGAARLAANGGVFTDTLERHEAIALHKRESNPLIDFLAEETARDESGYLLLSEFRNRFRAWYGRSSVSDTYMRRHMRVANIEVLDQWVGDSSIRVIEGYKWKRAA